MFCSGHLVLTERRARREASKENRVIVMRKG